MISKQLRGYVCYFLAGTFLVAVSALTFGQGDQGRIARIVRDQTGAIIPSVTVSARNARTGEERTALTGERGDYIITALKPSTYTASAKLAGFGPTEASGLQLVLGQTLTLDLTLHPEGISQSVTVEADAAEARVQTSSASLGANVDSREVSNLPINGRQLLQLYLQAPGAQNTGSGTFGDIRFNGRAV